MCLMTEKQASYTDGEIEEENMLTEVFNESDRLYSPFTVGKEIKSTVTDNILLSDIGGYPDQQNKTVALQLQRIPTQFSSELPEDYSLLNKWKQVRDVEHMSDLENWKSERNNEKSTNKDPIDRLHDELIMERKILINMVQDAYEREIGESIWKAALVVLKREIIKSLLKGLNTSFLEVIDV